MKCIFIIYLLSQLIFAGGKGSKPLNISDPNEMREYRLSQLEQRIENCKKEQKQREDAKKRKDIEEAQRQNEIERAKKQKEDEEATRHFLEKTVTDVEQKIEDKMDGERCSICIRPLQVMPSKKTPCGHGFHDECLKKWIKNECPMCREPLDLGMNIEQLNKELKSEVYGGILDNVKRLVRHGANVNAVDDYGSTPLHIAAIMEYTHIVEFLLKQNTIEINAQDSSNRTPLLKAVRWSYTRTNVIKLLLKNHADARIPGLFNGEYFTPLSFAKMAQGPLLEQNELKAGNSWQKVIDLLAEYEANEYGDTEHLKNKISESKE